MSATELKVARVDDEGRFHCPNGHSHSRGPIVIGKAIYRCLGCGEAFRVEGVEPKFLAPPIDGGLDNYCPCTLAEPCCTQCSCSDPLMSGGCSRCCRYGNMAQRKEVAELIAARARAREWQPFESAPTDGREILVWREDAGVFIAMFAPTIGPDDTWETGRTGEPAWMTDYGEDLTGDLPTHWMPKPDGPNGERE